MTAFFDGYLGYSPNGGNARFEDVTRLFHYLAIAVPFAIAWRQVDEVQEKLLIVGMVAIAGAVTGILPPAGSAVLPALVLAGISGSRGLAVSGVVLEVYFIARYYYSSPLYWRSPTGIFSPSSRLSRRAKRYSCPCSPSIHAL